MANWRYESYGKIQNFSSISLKLCVLDQKTQGHGVCVNNTYRATIHRGSPEKSPKVPFDGSVTSSSIKRWPILQLLHINRTAVSSWHFVKICVSFH